MSDTTRTSSGDLVLLGVLELGSDQAIAVLHGLTHLLLSLPLLVEEHSSALNGLLPVVLAIVVMKKNDECPHERGRVGLAGPELGPPSEGVDHHAGATEVGVDDVQTHNFTLRIPQPF